MQRRQHDANLGALNAHGAFTGSTVDVVVLSADEALLTTLQDAASAEHAIWHAPSADAAVDLLVGGRCGILIADLQFLHTEPAALLERLQAQFPELVLLATGRREEEGSVAALISKGCVYRFLHKPVSPARANLFLATATRRYNELVHSVSPALATGKQLTQPSNRIPLLGGGLAALALVLGAIWYIRRPDAPSPDTEQPTAAPRPTIVIADEIAAARQALAAGRLSAPPGDNALDRYRSVLAAEADNAEALAGVKQIVDMLASQVTQTLQARDVPGAARALTALQRAEPDYPQLDALREQLLTLSRPARTEAPAAAAKTSQTAPKAPPAPARATPNIASARARIAAGQFIEPADDSAVHYLRRAREQGEDESANQIAATDLGTRLLRQTRQAIAAADVPQAQRWFAAAIDLDREFALALPNLAVVGRQLDDLRAANASAADQQSDEPLAAAIQPHESSQPIGPAGEERAAASQVVQAATLKRTREVPPAYPLDAERRRTEGWVDVDFTIAPDGSTQNLVVRQAQPADIFDKAAVDALRKWRFEPVLRNGEPTSQRATLRVRFSLE